MIKNTFPKFKKFESEAFLDYQNFIFSFPQHADLTLNNLIIWYEGKMGIEYSWINGNILLKINDSILLDNSKEPYYILIGDNSADETLDRIFKTKTISKLTMVPDYFVKELKEHKFIVHDDEPNKDYVLDVSALLLKKGKQYDNFRHKLNYFNKKYEGSIKIKHLNLLDPKDVNLLINGIHSWKVDSFSANGNDPNRHDGQAINKLLMLQSILPVKHNCIGVFIDNKLEGVSIYQITHSKEKIAIGSHIKCNSEIKGIFDYLVYSTAKDLSEHGIEKLNAEFDMGIEGIKKYKTSLNPVDYYKKYSISL